MVLEIAKPIDRLISPPKEQKDIHDLRGLRDLGDLPAIFNKKKCGPVKNGTAHNLINQEINNPNHTFHPYLSL